MNLLTCSKQDHFAKKDGELFKELLTSQTVKAMKLTFILLTAAFLQLSARGLSQNVTLAFKDAPMEKVFREIEKQTGLGFLYTKRMLNDIPKVTINVKNAEVNDALKLCFKDVPLTFTIIEQTIVVKPVIKEEDILTEESLPIDIRGRVVNDKGDPVEGVTVTVKGSKAGTSTDINGEFVLKNIDRDATLVFSSVNLETYELKVGGRTSFGTITLKTKVLQGEEVVVPVISNGYQRISKERATGSYDVIGRETLDKRFVSDISTSMQGLVPGLQAKENLDGTMNFLIRGTSSLYVNTQPLLVVDGFPIANTDFSTINPNDVESITFLKDAAAASIWGARSANGVIVITTKKGKTGREKMTVEANAFTRVSSMIDLDQVMSQANTTDFINYEKLAYQRELFFTTPYSASFTNIGKPMTLAEELMFANRYGQISTAQMNKGLDSLSQINNRGQLNDYLLRNGINNQYSLSLAGSTEHSRTFGSVLYETKKDGIVKNGYDRLLLNFNNEFEATRFLVFSFGANVQYRKTESSGPTISEMQSLSPYETLLDPNGNYSVNLNSWNREQQNLLPLNKFPYPDWSYNLLREVRGRSVTNELFSARIQGGVTIKIMRGLDFDIKGQYEKIKSETSNFNSDDTWYTRNMVNTYVDYNQVTKVVGTQYLPKGGILKPSSSNQQNWVIRTQLTLSRPIGKKFAINAIAGTETSRNLTTSVTSPWVYGYYPDKNQSAVPPYGYGSSVDLFKTFTATTATATLSGGNTTYGWRAEKGLSFFGDVGLTYNTKYTLTLSARSDATNYITDDPKLRWAPLWSVGGLWHLYQEKFMENNKFIDRLDVRLTYGGNGNTEKSTSTKPLVSVSTSPSTSTGTITATIADNGNPLLQWEKTYSTNLGIDFSMFKNKLSGKIDLYNRLGKNIVGTILLPAVTGTTTGKFNNAEMLNQGIELELGTSLNITKNVRYTTTVTYAYNKNRIQNLYFPSILAFQLVDPTTSWVQGRPVGAIYSYTYLGMTDSVPYVAGPKGVPYTMNAVQLHNTGLGLQFLNYDGSIIPPHTLGWMNNFGAYGFNLSVLFVGKFGGVFRDPVFNFPTYVGSAKTNVDRFVANVFAGDPNIPNFPKYREPQFYLWDRYVPNLEGLVESSSYIECKEIDLNYDMPRKIARKLQLNGIRLYAQVRDLGLVWSANKNHYNPEWLPGSQRPVTAFTFGINAKL
jgi:TonB-dependent starch-binding outer membrane protein SusC